MAILSNQEKLKNVLRASAAYSIRIVTNLLNVFPIHQNRIMFYSFNGKSFNCNPREIYQFLQKKFGDAYEYVWSFRKPEMFAEFFPNNVKLVKFRSIRHYYYMKTSKVVVYNVHEEGEVARRRNQFYIQTWHASNGYKNLKLSKNKLLKWVDLLHHRNYSYVLSGCENMSERRIRGSMHFQGEIIRGTPRMDVMFEQSHIQYREEVKKEYHIPEDSKILLFAPTWRKNRSDTNYGLNYAELQKILHEKFGGNWYILVRFHPNVKTNRNWDYGNTIINVTKYPEMQKLLCAADVMISDYSSCVWDYSFTYRPCFLFLPVFEEMGGNSILEIPIEEWGFPFCFSMEGLKRIIYEFDTEQYKQQIQEHHRKMGSYEDGHATERVCGLIAEKLTGK